MIGFGDTEEQRAQHKILKGLLHVEDDKSFVKMNDQNVVGQQRMGIQRPGAVGTAAGAADSKNDNPMLLHLLNNDDDNMDNRSGMRNNSELLRQLQKEEPKDHHHAHHGPLKTLANEELMQRLCFQGNDFTNRKRPMNDGDDGPSAKRSEKPSKLCEKNKMLASLLSNPSKAPAPLPPALKVFPDIPRQGTFTPTFSHVYMYTHIHTYTHSHIPVLNANGKDTLYLCSQCMSVYVFYRALSFIASLFGIAKCYLTGLLSSRSK